MKRSNLEIASVAPQNARLPRNDKKNFMNTQQTPPVAETSQAATNMSAPGQRTMYIVLAVIVTAVIVGVSVFFVEESRLNRELEVLQEQIFALQQSAQNQAEIDDMSNLKTYTDSNLGFTLKYPANWVEQDGEFISQEGNDWLKSTPVGGVSSYFMKIVFTDTEQIPETNSDINVASNSIDIDGVEGKEYRQVVTEESYGAPLGKEDWLVVLPIKNGYLNFILESVAYRDIFNQMLSTFKFLDTTASADSPVSVIDPNSLVSTTGWKTYTAGRFEFKYPSNLFTTRNADINIPPDYSTKIPGFEIVHEVPIKHCGLSGLPEHCTPTTANPEMGFFVLDKTLMEVVNPMLADHTLGSIVREFTLTGKNGYYYNMGAEGEGIFQYFLPLDNNATLVIQKSYINEKMVGIYDGAETFIPLQEQESLSNTILSTLKFTN